MHRLLLLGLLLLAPIAARGEEPAREPRRLALLVGCSEYPELRKALGRRVYNRAVRLRGPENDATLWREVLTRHLDFENADIQVLAGWSDAKDALNPTAERIRAALASLAERVREGDRVFVAMSGHGVQVPDRSGDEGDDLDEAFLPADVATWSATAGELPGALLDDELNLALRKIRDAGAHVWLVMDCCHAGTMLRGGDAGLVYRHLDAALLGIPTTGRRGVHSPVGSDAEHVDMERIVAFYGAHSHQRAPEMRLPSRQQGAKSQGLLTFTLASILSRLGSGITYEQLYRQSVAVYRSLPYTGATPLAEGALDASVGVGVREGPFAPPLLIEVRPYPDTGEERLVVGRGRLAGILPDTLLAVYDPVGPRTPIGHVRVEESDLHEAWCRIEAGEGPALPPLEGDRRVCPAEIVERPLPDYALRWSVVDEQGAPLGRETLGEATRAALDAEAARRKFPYVEQPDAADWLVVWSTDGLRLRPARTGATFDIAFRVEDGRLLEALGRIFRVENLRRFALEGDVAPLPPGLVVEVQRLEGGRFVSVGDDVSLTPGDSMRIHVANHTARPQQVWIFFLDARYGLHLVQPGGVGVSPVVPPTRGGVEGAGDQGVVPVDDSTLGLEHLLVLTLPHVDGEPTSDFHWLAQAPLRPSRTGIRHKGAAQGAGFGDLLDELAFGRGLQAGHRRTRGPALGASAGVRTGPAVKLISLTTGWGEVRPPADFGGPTMDVGAPAESAEPDAWALGPRVRLARTPHARQAFDLLLGGDTAPRQVLVDLDGNSAVLGPDAAARLARERTFDAEVAFHFHPDRREAFYDADGDGVFDRVLVDLDADPAADEIRTLGPDGSWTVEDGVNVPFLRTTWMGFIDRLPRSRRGIARLEAIARLRSLTRP